MPSFRPSPIISVNLNVLLASEVEKSLVIFESRFTGVKASKLTTSRWKNVETRAAPKYVYKVKLKRDPWNLLRLSSPVHPFCLSSS